MIYKNRLYTRVRKCHYKLRYISNTAYTVFRMKQVVNGVHWHFGQDIFFHSAFHTNYKLRNSDLPF